MKRFNKKIIPVISLSVFLNLFVFIFFIFPFLVDKLNLNSLLIILLVSLLVLIISAIYGYLYYRFSEYEFNDKGVHVRRGVIFRKKSFLDYNRIHAINKKQNLLENILGIGRLMIDSGSTNTASTAEICIRESNSEIERLINQLENRDINEKEVSEISEVKEEKQNLFDYSPKLKIFNALVDAFRIFIILITFDIGATILVSIFQQYMEDTIPFHFFAFFCFLIFLACIVIFVVRIVNILFHYYNFRVYRNNDNIEIYYGLFTTFHHTFKLNKIKAVIIKQSLIYRIFGYASISLEVIGYDEDNAKSTTNDKYLIPICKNREVEGIIDNILGNFKSVEKEETAKSFFSFVSWKIVVSIICHLVIFYIGFVIMLGTNTLEYINYLIAGVLTLFIVVLSLLFFDKILQYKYEGIGINDEFTTVYHGGLIHNKTIILNKYIIGITDCTTPLRKKKDIYSYSIHIKTNDISNEINVEMVNNKIKERLLNIVKI